MATSGCLYPAIVAGWRGGRLGVVKCLIIIRYGVVAHRQYRVFDGGVAGAVAGPLHWRAGWQTGSLAWRIALNGYFCQSKVRRSAGDRPCVSGRRQSLAELPGTRDRDPRKVRLRMSEPRALSPGNLT